MLTLCEFVKLNTSRQWGSGSTHGVAQAKRAAWAEAAVLVNEAGEGEGVAVARQQKKWNDVSYHAKKYLSRRRGKETVKCTTWKDIKIGVFLENKGF